jgi:excisionase family DNA binding protein
MQAYATAEIPQTDELRVLNRRLAIPDTTGEASAASETVLDELMGQLADLVAAKVAARLTVPPTVEADEWFDTRRAAEYLGIHRDSLRRLAAAGEIPAEQASAGCKLFFRRSELDAWRCPGTAPVVGIRSRRHD